MDIQSTSNFKHSHYSNHEDGDKEHVSKERIQSIEPEIKSLGAVGVEGTSYVPDTKIRTVVVAASPTTKLDTLSEQEKKEKLFYATHPILLSSAFTKECLDKISKTIRELALYITGHIECVEVKIAALRVQALTIKMIRGEDSNNETEQLTKNINKLILRCFDSAPQHTIPALDPDALWPIDKDDCTNSNFSAIGLLEAKEYFSECKRDRALAHRKKIEQEKDKSDYRNYVESILKELKEPDKMNKLHSHSKITIEKPTYLFLPEKEIESIEANSPSLRKVAKESNIFLVSHKLTTANDFEKKLLACYNLYINVNSEDARIPSKLKPIFFLDVYKERLKDDVKSGKFTALESQQIVCTWVRTLSKYFQYFQEKRSSKIRAYRQKNPKNKGMEKTNEATIGCERCLSLTILARDDGFLSLATYGVLTRLVQSVLQESRRTEKNAIKKLLVEVQEYVIDAAIGDEKKWGAYTDYMMLCELFGFKEKFYKASDAASQYSLFPIIIQIWHSLGLAEANHPWITSIKLMPEYAVEYLIKIGRQKNKILLMKGEIDAVVKVTQDPDIPDSEQYLELYTIFYNYIVGQEKFGKILLQHKGKYWHEFFVIISLVANEELEQSITSIENFLSKEKNKISMEEKILRRKVQPLLALVHKRIADTVTCDTKKTRHLEQALSYLFSPAAIHKELYLSIAIIQEQLNDLKSAYNSYCTLEKHCKTFPIVSPENCQLPLIIQAKEKLEEMLLISSDNRSPEESDLQKSEQDDTLIKKRNLNRKSKQKSSILTTQTALLTPDEKEIILPLASLRMDKTPENDIETEEPEECTLQSEECVQEDNDTNWTFVRKRATHYLKIPHEITNEAFELSMSYTKHSRHFLSMKLLHSANIDYDGLLSEHDRLYDKTENITLKQMVFQNKMWSIRHKTFNTLVLDYESNKNNIPVDNIKTKLREGILKSLYSNIESVIKALTSETLPETWRNQPGIIFSVKGIAFILDKNEFLRFRIQLGAQCSTMAHIMRDIFSDPPNGTANMEYALSLFGRRSLDDFFCLSTLFYNCRDRINPEHKQ